MARPSTLSPFCDDTEEDFRRVQQAVRKSSLKKTDVIDTDGDIYRNGVHIGIVAHDQYLMTLLVKRYDKGKMIVNEDLPTWTFPGDPR